MFSRNFSKQESEPTQSDKPHSDLQRNQAWARDFIENASPHFLEGMSMRLGASKFPEQILYALFTPPGTLPEPSFAQAVSLNDHHEATIERINWLANKYHKMAQDFWKERAA